MRWNQLLQPLLLQLAEVEIEVDVESDCHPV